MREEFQAIDWSEPPVGDLVERSVAQGRRMRAARRLRVGGAAGLAVLAVAGASVGLVATGSGPSTPAPAAVTVAAPSPSATSAAPVEKPRAKATPAGLLALLLDTLPEGKTSHYAGVREEDDDDVALQTLLDRGKGPGMIRVNVINTTATSTVTWTPLGNGFEYHVVHVPGNCLQETVVVVRHPSKLMVQFNLYACPAYDGVTLRKNVLTVQEAVKAGADPRWGLTIDPAFNKQGAARFPHLSEDFSVE